ncbi:polysaccharide biosynthesis protein [Psychrobacillus sp. INOP01]|uniref:putative polysaccharide biosynthesis protein n=1 Tax=Psychrobacillus sp. INOP01 TaxID=2829187 RepID=UPI001BADEA9B|nr:polysaccharide biosynthesis protein [Psychrobacillus sp. INOP01]QUG39908.1 polysaccharide biosynthesis protein [Psychrobacillus sp. INOP01]
MGNEWNMKTYMKGAAMLTIAAIIVKLLSAVYRVPFQNLVGDEGFYIYQQVYPFIGIITTWTSFGFAVALSKILSDYKALGNDYAVPRVKQIAFYYIAFISIIFFILLFMGADFLAETMGDANLAQLLKAGSYVILLMPMLAVLKGDFQSDGHMQPVAYAQVVEQVVRVFVILFGTWLIVSNSFDLYRAGSMAMYGAVAGELAGVILLSSIYWKTMKQTKKEKIKQDVPVWPIVKSLTLISISASISALLFLLFQLVDSFTVFQALIDSGMDRHRAMEKKGVYDRGQPLVQLGIVIASTLSLAIVPLVAHRMNKGSGRTSVPFMQLTYRVAFTFGVAAAMGLIVVLPYVNEMLFQTKEESTTLMVFSFQIIWMSLILTLMAMLQGSGMVKVPTLFLLLGVLCKWLLNSLLVPMYGVLGAAISGNVSLAIIYVLMCYYFKKTWHIQFAPAAFYKGITKATILMIVCVIVYVILGDAVLFDNLSSRLQSIVISLTSVTLGAAIFLVSIAKRRVIAEKEWFLLPFGRRMATFQLWLNKEK